MSLGGGVGAGLRQLFEESSSGMGGCRWVSGSFRGQIPEGVDGSRVEAEGPKLSSGGGASGDRHGNSWGQTGV